MDQKQTIVHFFGLQNSHERYKEFTKCLADTAANSIITYINNTDDVNEKTQLKAYSTGDIIT